LSLQGRSLEAAALALQEDPSFRQIIWKKLKFFLKFLIKIIANDQTSLIAEYAVGDYNWGHIGVLLVLLHLLFAVALRMLRCRFRI
jgi:hypothetical protein